ncbi:trypco2 family protein [Streptomyces sp. NPDC058308]|uniref:trypco2 family protein n=1 Tax=Streptomyces sp. NPDC058308 TaxID=3346440 RepID=UPI0036ED5966
MADEPDSENPQNQQNQQNRQNRHDPQNPQDPQDWLDLADALDLLRAQIAESQRRARTADIRFDVGEITVDFELELHRTRAAGGGLRFAVVQAEGRAESAHRATQRVSLTLRPRGRDAGAGDVAIGDWEE